MKRFITLGFIYFIPVCMCLVAAFLIYIYGEDGSWAMGVLIWGPPALFVLGLPITMVISAVVIYSDIGRGGVQVLGVLIAIAGIAAFFLGILVKDTLAERSSVEWQTKVEASKALVENIADPVMAIARCQEIADWELVRRCESAVGDNIKKSTECAYLPYQGQRVNCARKVIRRVNPERPTNPCADARIQELSELQYNRCMSIKVWRDGKPYLPLVEVLATAGRN
jgi:hypothetical protein